MDDRTAVLRDLVKLFDDTDVTVVQCVDRKLHSMGRSVIGELAGIASEEENPSLRKLILDRMERTNLTFRFEDLSRLSANASEGGFSLYETLFIISSIFDAGLSRDGFQRMYYDCAALFTGEISQARTALENMEIFNHIFFRKLGFKISDDKFSDAGAALLPSVFENRCGNPFSIAVIWFTLTEEVQLPLYPVCYKGGFIPAYLENGRELFYVNLNDNGALVSESELQDGPLQIHSRSVIPGIWAESLAEVFSRCNSLQMNTLARRVLSIWTSERFLSEDSI